MKKELLFKTNQEYQDVKIRVRQLNNIKNKTANQKLELRILGNLKHNKEIELVNSMLTHPNLKDLFELTGLEEIKLR